jgi:hypothetical protein
MNLCKLMGLSALFLLAGSTILPAQSARTPGAMDEASNGTPMHLSFSPWASSALPNTNIARVEAAHAKHVRFIWIASILAMTAGTAADAGTSWHKRESNGFLASSDGTFGAKGLAIKGGIAAGVLTPQLIFRRHRDWYAAFAVGNFAETGIFAGASIHNLNTTSPAK